MRKTVIGILAVVTFGQFVCAQKSSLEIPAGASLELDYPSYELYELQLKGKLGKGIEVQVLDKTTGAFVRGFGLGPLGKVEVMVEKNSKIVFTNTGNRMAGLSIKVREMDQQELVTDTSTKRISFTLRNNSNKPIPLLIPNVMNPNLSPNSSSGVDLEIGQKLLFRNRGKKYVLFTVDESIKEGSIIDVSKLLEKRKTELGL